MNPRYPSEAEIFENAAELSGEERAAYLKKVTDGDDQLRQRVEHLLASHKDAEAGAFMGKSPGASARTIVLTTNMIPVTEKPGDKIGRYKLREQIGEGGCGVVYVAEQEEPVRRRVALKVIKLGMDTKQVVARFEAERQALALMDHPNIAKVLDAGATDTGRPYFVMELVRGIKITDYCDKNHLSTEERLKLFIQVCSAIQHAHQKGIIHRDIKPSNILVTLHDGVPVPKVIDFGIAKATSDQRLTDKTVYTAFEQFIGTPAYMSPEQAEMSGLDIDTRSDIYSLGVLLYELLTGRTPFDAATLLKAGLDQMRRIIREQEPQRPSTRLSTLEDADLTDVAQHRRADAPKLIHLVRGDLDWIVMKSLEKDRTRRYETVNGLAVDVKRHLDDEPVAARPPSLLYRLQKLLRKHKLAFTASAVVAIVLAIGFAVAITLRKSEQVAKQRANAAEQAQNQLRQQAEMQQLRNQARSLFEQNELPKAETIYRELLSTTRARLGNDHPDVANAIDDLARTLRPPNHQYYPGLWKKTDEAERLYRESLSIRQKLLGNDSSDVLHAMENLARALDDQDKYDEAQALYQEALNLSRKMFGNDDPKTMPLIGALAFLLERRGNWIEAESLYRKKIQLWGGVPDDGDATRERLGTLLKLQGKLAEAESIYRDEWQIERSYSDLGDGMVDNLVGILRLQGKLGEAELARRQSLALRRLLLEESDLRIASSIRKLADVLHDEGKESEATAERRKALLIEGKHLPGDVTNVISHVVGIAEDHAVYETNYVEGDKVFDELIALCDQDRSNKVRLLHARGILRVHEGRLKEAAGDYAKLVSLSPEDHWFSFQLSPLLVECGNLNAYTNNFQMMFARFGATNDARVLERTAKAALLLPLSGTNLAFANSLVERAISNRSEESLACWFNTTKGLAEYRQGNNAEAILWANKGLNDPSVQGLGYDSLRTAALAVLAMSHHQLAQKNESRIALTKAVELAESAEPGILNVLTLVNDYERHVNLDEYWHDWLIGKILVREAKLLIEGPSAVEPPR